MIEMLVSILIPTYNRDAFLSETIDSALSQTYKDIEIIIVDNKSSDNTWNIIQHYAKQDSRIKAFQNDSNIGIVRNWRRCVEEASGEYGKILWSDDLIAPEFLEKTIGFLKENKDVGFVFTGTEIFIDGTNYKSDHFFIGPSGLYDSRKFINGVVSGGNYPFSPGCALFRLKDINKNLLLHIPNKIGCDFSLLGMGNDVLIFLLTARDYEKFAFVNERLSYFRDHEGSESIKAKNGNIQLRYDLAVAHFVENYKTDLIEKMNSRIWVDLMRYKISKEFNMNEIQDFYCSNKILSLSFSTIISRIFYKIVKYARRFIVKRTPSQGQYFL
jgi:glycosyltransferase involved in cell wall biosynthesis